MTLEVPTKRQAVILVENEITDMECNASLLMILNTPLILYIIDHLLTQNVEQIFIACNLENKIKISTIIQNRYKSKVVQFIVCDETKSSGEIIRQISENSQLESDELIVIKGDVITTLQLDPILQFHRQNCRDGHVVTVVYRKNHIVNESRSDDDKTIVIIDGLTNRILKVDDRKIEKTNRPYYLRLSLNKETPKIEVHGDFMETGVFIFTRQGLSLFSDADNCDMNEFPEMFYPRILENDITNFKLHCYIAKDNEYSVRIRDIATFRKVSTEMLQRHGYPYTTDLNVFGYDYNMYGHNVVSHASSKVPLKILQKSKNVLLCERTTIGINTTLNNSVICSDCIVGEGSSIEDSQIFNGTTIGKNVQIISSVIGNNCIIEDDAIVSQKYLCENTIFGKDGIEKSTKPNDQLFTSRVQKHNASSLLRSGSARINLIDNDSDDEEQNSIDEDKQQPFSVFRSTVKRFIEAYFVNHEKHMLLTQITSLKATFNYSMSETVSAIIEAFLLIGDPNGTKTTLEQLKSLDTSWEILEKFTTNCDEQVEILFYLCEFCDDFKYFEPTFIYILHALHENEVVSEDAIWKWKEDCSNSEDYSRFIELSQGFLTALKNAQNEEENGDEEEGDDDEYEYEEVEEDEE
ncbi:sugar-1-phosphate guanyl transferase, putative [Entamoeba histolytica HM-3:IMSS]|uniref:Translation initiation factor eIF2B subunit epsilon n=6 Tax=Entamoeba histolytica TaxID=5759 RepID=C4LXH0_ENTH1|nr:translation initiation factor eIF-2B epsilon subunit, putative [Entamoeba histolytica HM-1:IMSS]EMD43159.1 sugar 1-phosphate guanyl transferase, putative [Entamoeba histolytica KU27]EMS15422.1 sugar-1-phosphate guanyl transferase, putative [Entamoeba histolytica HM-3:IMSS]ENY60763.1 sugar-1-phosphate guanyl transferase, putative [Entamoeba histolytica HM-1:IMSS-A]GAT93449.1 translation initiation factor eIF-2B epsilon subunit, putative [Entamoeba histolytica]EAL50126.1 translation initiatio|eukprot:XP_655514.1 translation initiation factor eIF-2B epsilon subunit, putative [Entamoeba histolytica HM-1:IMSS]